VKDETLNISSLSGGYDGSTDRQLIRMNVRANVIDGARAFDGSREYTLVAQITHDDLLNTQGLNDRPLGFAMNERSYGLFSRD